METVQEHSFTYLDSNRVIIVFILEGLIQVESYNTALKQNEAKDLK